MKSETIITTTETKQFTKSETDLISLDGRNVVVISKLSLKNCNLMVQFENGKDKRGKGLPDGTTLPVNIGCAITGYNAVRFIATPNDTSVGFTCDLDYGIGLVSELPPDTIFV